MSPSLVLGFLCSALTPSWAGRIQAPGTEEVYAFFARTVDFGGDFDGDGGADILVGQLGDWDDGSRVLAYSGRSGEQLLHWTDPPVERAFGRTVAALPDLDGDGISELAAASGRHPRAEESVRIVSGRTGERLHSIDCDAGSRFGDSLLVLRDSQSEMACQLLVSSWEKQEDGTYAWSVTSYSSEDWKPVWKRSGPSSRSDAVLWAPLLVQAGDLDHDGCFDVVMNSWIRELRNGWIAAISGASGKELWNIRSRDGDGRLGWAIAPLEDLDADGVDDVLVSRQDPHCGSILVCSGANGRVLQTRELTGRGPADADECDPVSITRLADLDGDSFSDYAALEFGFLWHVATYSGKSGKKLYEIPCVERFGCNGASVENRAIGGGDVNGDGAGDFVITVFTMSNVGDSEQGFHLLSGRDGSEIFHKTMATESAAPEKR
jgi:hypothetical protein